VGYSQFDQQIVECSNFIRPRRRPLALPVGLHYGTPKGQSMKVKCNWEMEIHGVMRMFKTLTGGFFDVDREGRGEKRKKSSL
jgi:hypothetical protein